MTGQRDPQTRVDDQRRLLEHFPLDVDQRA